MALLKCSPSFPNLAIIAVSPCSAFSFRESKINLRKPESPMNYVGEKGEIRATLHSPLFHCQDTPYCFTGLVFINDASALVAVLAEEGKDFTTC